MKQNNFKQSEFEEYEEFLEFKRMKQRYEIKNNQPANNSHYEEDEEESGGGILSTLGIIVFLLSSVFTFTSGSSTHMPIHIGAFVFLSLFLIWGYNTNKEAFYLYTKIILFIGIGWTCWKMGLFS
jgi:hypothetical protein